MRLVTLILAALLAAVQWSLWLGHGSWPRVLELRHQLEARQAANAALRARNQALEAEIASLRRGSEAIEERARGELHMMRADETFFQFAHGAARAPAAAGPAASDQALQLGVE